MPGAIDLIVGLGNPGSEYAMTRHNAGFWFADLLARAHGLSFRSQSKFHGELCRLDASEGQCWLLKPATFMNRSGQSVAALANFYRIPVQRILVVHDELDLPPGTARLKQGGGHGGHNGLRDIMGHLGGDFLRLRIGIGHPGDASLVTPYVLGRARAEEEDAILEAIVAALEVLPLLFEDKLQHAMNALHSSPRA